jgi:hypothetical protein
MAEGLQIVIGADASKATKEIQGLANTLKQAGQDSKEVASVFKSTTGAVLSAGLSWNEFKHSIKTAMKEATGATVSCGDAAKAASKEWGNYKKQMAGVVPPIKAVGDQLKKLPSATNSSALALNNLSRIAQDAPFGFIGITNNINPMLESFQRLKQETGSTGKALKAMASGLTGAGGLGLAVGIVSSLLVVFGDKLFKTKKPAVDAADALKEYVKSLGDVRAAQLQGAQDAQKELVTLKSLYEATQNANIPLSKRKQLVDELQNQYPAYFKNISDETILAGGAKDAYNKLAQSILAAAKARAAQDTLVDIQKQILTQDEKITDGLVKETEAQKALNKERAKVNNQNLSGVQGASDAAGFKALNLSAQLTKAEEKYKDAIKETAAAAAEKAKLLDRAERIADSLNETITANPDALIDPKAKVDTPKLAKDIEDIVKKVKVKEIDVIIPMNFFAEANKEAEGNKELKKYIENKLFKDIKPVPLPIPIAPKPNLEVDKLKEEVEKLLSKALQNISIDGFAQLGENIGTAIASGNIGEAFKGLFSFIGDSMQQLGKQIIAMAPIIAALKAAIKTLNPAALLPAGIALVAIGAALKNIQPKGFAAGGVVSGPVNALVGEGIGTSVSNPEVIAPLDKLKKLIGGGGGEFPDYLPQHRISGDALLLWYEKATKSKGRRF